MIIKDDYYPPITLKDMEYLFDIPQSKFVKMAKYNEIDTQKIGQTTYVSVISLEKMISSLNSDRKSIQRKIIKRKLMAEKENKILEMSKLIKIMRRINGEQKDRIGGVYKKRKPKKFYSSNDLNLILNQMDDFATIESLSIDLTYSEIKKIILDVKEMNLVYYTDTMAVRLKELKIKG